PALGESQPQGDLHRLLERWERQCAANHAIEAHFTLVKSDPEWDQVERFEATAVLARPDKLFVNLTEIGPTGSTRGRAFHHRIIATGRRLYLLANPTKQVVVLNAGRSGGGGNDLIQSDLIALLFDLKADLVLKQYQIAVLKESAQGYIVQFTPRTPAGAADFRRLDILLETESLLPTHLRLVAPKGRDTQLSKFTRAIRNPVVKGAVLQPPELKGWTVIDLSIRDRPTARPLSGPQPPPVYSEVAPR